MVDVSLRAGISRSWRANRVQLMIPYDVILVRDRVYGSNPDASWERHQREQPLEQGDVITIEAEAKAAPGPDTMRVEVIVLFDDTTPNTMIVKPVD